MVNRTRTGFWHGVSTCEVCGRWPARPVCDPCLRHFAPVGPGGLLARDGAVSALVAAVDYGYPWDRLIARFKFSGECGLAPALACLLGAADGLDHLVARCDHVVPIPLSTDRLVQRGYNQSWELARRLCLSHPRLKGKGLPQALTRRGGRPDQHTLGRRERLHNLDQAFAVAPHALATLRNAHVLLVDDVVTTGATLDSAARTLLAAGVATVSAAVLARTP